MSILPTLFAVFRSAFRSRVALELENVALRHQLNVFYEKVVKVKADVAAILNFFSRSQIEADNLDAAPWYVGGIRKGGFSGAIMAGGHNVG